MTQNVPTETIGLRSVNHVGIVVSDLDASIRFYEALTGTKVEQQDMVGGPRLAALKGVDKVMIRYAMVHLQGINLELVQYDEPKPAAASYSAFDVSSMHLCFEVDDLDTVLARMKKAGLAIAGEPLTLGEEDLLKHGIGTKSAYFDDPDGVHLEVIEPHGSFRRRS